MFRIILTAIISGIFFTACQNSQKTVNTANENNIPYTIADRYFVKNTVGEFNTPKIESQQKFDEFFGMATVMGEGGQPTVIDFARQYVIAIVKPETNRSTTIIAVNLEKNEKSEIVFTYKIETGEENSYTMRPLLLIAVDKTNNGNVVLNEIK